MEIAVLISKPMLVYSSMLATCLMLSNVVMQAVYNLHMRPGACLLLSLTMQSGGISHQPITENITTTTDTLLQILVFIYLFISQGPTS